MVVKSLTNSPVSSSLQPPTPYLLTETSTTTTTEVVTTTTTRTTRFFSLPVWKKNKNSNVSPSTSQSAQAPAPGMETPNLNRASTYLYDKDLPPTPGEEGRTIADPSESDTTRETLRLQGMVHAIGTSDSSTATLAHAALGLGLGLPGKLKPPRSTNHPEVSTVSFALPDIDSQTEGLPNLQTPCSSPSSQRVPETETSSRFRRTRGLSLGSSLLNVNSSTENTKPASAGGSSDQHSPLKTLVRRSSFWSRRKATNERNDLPSRSKTVDAFLAPLPSFQPLSPLFSDNTRSLTESKASNHSRGLSRSYSEKSRLQRSHDIRGVDKQSPGHTASNLLINLPDQPNHLYSLNDLVTSPTSHVFDHLPDQQSIRERRISNPSPRATSFSTSPTDLKPRPFNPSQKKAPSKHPSREHEETPELYVQRLLVAVSKAEVATILASSADAFHVQALHAYIDRFDFSNVALDIALRKLLMDVGLPRETQQIDRVMEVFARHYLKNNTDLFSSHDHPYILAFSLIMLHTDAFNKSNKRKMTKPDYIKNTKLPGVSTEILDYFYDNIVFAPFIFVEDPVDVNGQTGFIPRNRTGSFMQSSVTGISILGKNNKIDPYFLITNNLLDDLRVDVQSYIPLISPYTCSSGAHHMTEEDLQRAFALANAIEVGVPTNSRPMSTFFTNTSTSLLKSDASGPNPLFPSSEVRTLKITKVGVLLRKDDLSDGGRKSSTRRWRSYTVLLTGSQLLLFRDGAWVDQLQPNAPITILDPRSFRPDEVLSVKDTVAVYDSLYSKYDNAFRLVMPDFKHILFQAADAQALGEWVCLINYASAFKSNGVRMRPLGMSGKEVELTGIAAATSHLHDLQLMGSLPSVSNIQRWSEDSALDLMAMLSPDSTVEPVDARHPVLDSDPDNDSGVPTAPEVDGADQFKATFDQVKEELAAERWGSPKRKTSSSSLAKSSMKFASLPSRSHILDAKIHDLNAKIDAAQAQLDSDMRLVKNISILTPFQKSTRDRLLTIVQSLSKRVMHARLDIVKYCCHRNVLAADVEAEQRDWDRAKHLALKAATETLHSQTGIPRMVVSEDRADEERQSLTSASQLTSSPAQLHHRPESTCESFHSALDITQDWPLWDSRVSISADVSTNGQPVASLSRRSSSCQVDDAASPRSSDEMEASHEKFTTAPEVTAEDWNKTQCAKRVSLVRVPSTYPGFLGRFEKGRRNLVAS